MSNTIIMLIVTAVIVPFFAPFIMDSLACFTIYMMNKARGKPTWKKGTRFARMVWPSGHVEENVIITDVTFKFVTLRVAGGTVAIKKRQMLGMVCVVRK